LRLPLPDREDLVQPGFRRGCLAPGDGGGAGSVCRVRASAKELIFLQDLVFGTRVWLDKLMNPTLREGLLMPLVPRQAGTLSAAAGSRAGDLKLAPYLIPPILTRSWQLSARRRGHKLTRPVPLQIVLSPPGEPRRRLTVLTYCFG